MAGGLEPGTEAPQLVLSDLEGHEVELAAPRPSGAVVLFWNPDCGFCRELHPALRAWEEERPARRARSARGLVGDRPTR